jgi:hypothetical protein
VTKELKRLLGEEGFSSIVDKLKDVRASVA